MFKGKVYQFRLGLPSIAGIGVVLLCLFFWMFLLGIWAGQTIILPAPPSGDQAALTKSNPMEPGSVQIIQPAGSKLPVKDDTK